jgi:hypothetical protein
VNEPSSVEVVPLYCTPSTSSTETGPKLAGESPSFATTKSISTLLPGATEDGSIDSTFTLGSGVAATKGVKSSATTIIDFFTI